MIIYLHGFNSSGNTANTELLKKDLAQYDIELVAPKDYAPYSPRVAVDKISKLIEKYMDMGEEPIIMGSSLGGYYARFVADIYGLKCILVNPSLNPKETLKGKIGENTNFVTGEKYLLTERNLNILEANFNMKGSFSGEGTLVLLNEGDEVIDHNIAVKEFWSDGKVIVYPGGEHRFNFTPTVTAEIVKFYNIMWG